ncbi:FecR family protein [Chitinophaga sp. CF118]|uniref:FecR family protein n=1 Tax=Chitinophaga sp. CF118 TaxID=1884367 RepID=UPI0008ED83CE|nr:FecR family protein [Chitinophaga sp. CF118]SFE00268.1 FecR family protein [Chitinophaga sp. CF118]
METIQHLIEKFWAGTITDTERLQLFTYMNDHEGAWKKYLEHGYDNHAEKGETLLSEAAADKVLAGLREKITPVKIVSVNRWTRWVAAAMIIIVAGWGIFQYSNNTRLKHSLAVNVTDVRQLLQHVNNGGHVEKIDLSDGSVVQLQPGSMICYYPSFDSLERNITLEGTAYFKVAKNNRPFSVTAKGFTTTALGTAFSVSTAKSGKVSVTLLEGKVVIKAARGSGMVMKEMYLTPGQEFVVNTELKQYHVQQFDNIGVGVKKTTVANQHIITMSFNKTDLEDVFAQLGTYYKVQIEMDTAAIERLSFTGSFEKSDSLQTILSAICNMNDLTFKKEGERIIISKQK